MMDWKTRGFVAVLIVFTCWLGWKYFTKSEVAVLPPTPLPSVSPLPTTTRPPASPQDIAKLIAVPVTVTGARIATNSENLAFAAEKKVGFVTLFGENIASSSAQRVITQIKESVGQEVLIAVDHEGGSVQRLSGSGFTKLPALQTLCEQDTLTRQFTLAKSALELQTAGINIVFAPVVDLASKSAVLKTRTCGSDILLTTAVSQEAVSAYLQRNILPVVKHYPGIGTTTKDLHAEIDAVYERPTELTIIKTLLQVKPKIGVMTTFILVSGLAENAPCALDFNCLMELESYSDQSLIFTDALEMKSALTGTDLETEKTLVQVSKEAIMAGNHVLVYGKGVSSDELEKVLTMLVTEYDTNVVMRQKIDRALGRLEGIKTELVKPQ